MTLRHCRAVIALVAITGSIGCSSAIPTFDQRMDRSTSATGDDKKRADAMLDLTRPLPMPTRVIDAHAHWDEHDADDKNGPSAEMIRQYRDSNVTGAVVHLKGLDDASFGANIPFKAVQCAGVRPPMTVDQVEAALVSKTVGCLKIYLGYVPKYANDEYYEPFYELAAKHQVPVVFHTGDTYDKDAAVKYADPLPVDDVAIQHRDVRFVIAHMGNPWFESAGEVVYKNDNVFVDVSALLIGDLSEHGPEAINELLVRPIRWMWLYVDDPRKMLFGTDWSLTDVKPYIQATQRAIPERHWDDFFYENAARVFGFSK